ncbi:6-phosphogluconolactonase [archaeon]|jgi:6-phosphogluconolactonase|nr:6-phosphogluconolactonase [archaeon]MBT6698488.1 6-phosphogluconolactonase [archaeon]
MLTLRGQKEEVETQVVSNFVDSVNALLENGSENVVVGFVGGRSIQGILNLLSHVEGFGDSVDWSRIEIFIVDERWVSVLDESSNFKQLASMLLESLYDKGLSSDNVHRFDIDSENGLESYNSDFLKFGGRFDIVFLGAGEDGHVASLYPNHSILDGSEGFVEVLDSPKAPAHRMSASRSLLEKSGLAYLLFFGFEKQEAYDNFLDPSVSVEECPAKLVLACTQSVVVTDLK